MSTLTTLVCKDWRVYRVAVFATLLLGALVYALFVASAVVAAVRSENHRVLDDLPDYISAGGICGIMVTVVMGSVFGGMAFAEERRERSADFMALLPPRRDHAAASKFIVTAAFLSVCVCVHSAAALAGNEFSPRPADWVMFPHTLAIFVGAGVMMFGVAWGLSCFLSSSAISASISIAAMLALALGVRVALEVSYEGRAQWFEAIFPALATLVGIVAWCVGTGYYLRRVEP